MLDLETKELKSGENVKILVQTKTSDGEIFIDVRKWLRFPGSNDFMPSRKGITLELSVWTLVIQKIRDLQQTASTSEKR